MALLAFGKKEITYSYP